ncbi:MAG: class I SAM-dependent methyltransferase [Chloroflexi bacterium]|nr:class I SAM-dependent methyltransferase [Chloroflexota bacterium]
MGIPRVKTPSEFSIEKRWREILLREPTPQNFQSAYDDLHRLYLAEAQGTGELYCWMTEKVGIAISKLITGRRHVLEIGTGDGRTSLRLARQGHSVVSIDLSKVALESASAAAAAYQDADVTYQFGDARSLRFADRSFGWVVSENLVEHLPATEIEQHFHQVWRVLREGGSYVFFTPSRLWDGRTSVGFHLHVYTLAEVCRIAQQCGFHTGWVEPRFLRFGDVLEVSGYMLQPVFAFERLLELWRVHRWPRWVKDRALPTILVRARKITRLDFAGRED